MRAEKHYVIDELKAKIGAASTLIFTNYNGASAEKMGALRALLHERNSGYLVVKNRLFALAAKEAGLDGELPGFGGQVGVAFTDDDSAVPVLKALVEFRKEHEVLELLGGFISGRPCTADQLVDLSRLPSKSVMRAQVLGTLLAVPRGLVSVFAGRLRSLLYVLNAYIEKQGGAPEAPAADAADDAPAAAPSEPAGETPAAQAVPEPESEAPAGEARE